MAPLPTVDGFWIPTNSVSKQRRTHSHYCHRKRHQIAQYVVVFGGMRQLPIKVIRSVPNYRYKIGQKVSFLRAARYRAPQGPYQVLERLPPQDKQCRYLIRSLDNEEYNQIVDESDL